MTQRKSMYSKKNSFGRSDFPEGFLFGTASSAYQYEGAINEAPRGESVWDTFVRKYPERNCYSNADQAIEFYKHYKEDIQRMKDINMDAFRFSISWPRIFPLGKKSKGVNKEGIKFYNDLIDELLANGITPLATLFHWDTPQALEDEYNGFLSEEAVDDFKDFAALCFEEFGDRVKLWVTLNEPWVYSIGGYDTGRKAPGRASKYMNEAAVAGESGLEVYTVSHNLLLAHAEAVEVFRNNPKCKDGKIGIAHCPVWFEPYDSNCPKDKEACERAMEFMFGWHMDPTVYGDYPEVMKKSIGKRLPSFTAAQSKKLIGSFDFVGVNYYSAFYVKNIDEVNHDTPNWRSDARIEWRKQNKAGQTLGVRGGSEWDFLYPQGLRKFLNYGKNKYESPKFMITENGHCDIDYEKKPKLSNLMDLQRTEYHKKHLQSIQQAIQEDGVVVEGYFTWSLLDNCEWNAGYGVRYGLFYVDYNNGLKRFPKMSAMWFKEFLKREEEIEDSEEEYVLKSTMNKKRFLLATGSSASCFIPKMSESSKALELLF
ncbi:Glycoside hydrolase superfamily [Arabidopsis thaliana x Arabidopsis arenosa]|uniref:Glycoside hydrolase superfamily n=1 Tax=Arabidopsis thaliana x Arabidopsis arenosa TaxID=1240361 RepID=A0A8T1ZTR1_9BRAS|nr:Glycoside hydrolase superfamily [Arabidopsis thaliana x Arabidopsis arenosa]